MPCRTTLSINLMKILTIILYPPAENNSVRLGTAKLYVLRESFSVKMLGS